MIDAARLRRIPAFADLADEDLQRIAGLASEVSVPAGKVLVREGDWSYEILAIEEGTAEVVREGARVAQLGPGDVVGEIGVMDAVPRTATVTAGSPMLLITLDRWDVKKLVRQAPDAIDHLRAVAEERRRDAQMSDGNKVL
jgi:CRP-like cAMP-binding protein